MNEVIRFKAPSGDEMVMLPAATFDRLVATAEDVDDVATYDSVKRKLATGEEEAVPSAVVDRLLAGENRIKVWREYRSMTMTALAQAAGIGQSFMSQIETGKRDGTLGTLLKIAAALRVSLGDLVEAPRTSEEIEASLAEKVVAFLGTVSSATELEIFDAVGEARNPHIITHLVKVLNRMAHTGRRGNDEPLRYSLPTTEEADDD